MHLAAAYGCRWQSCFPLSCFEHPPGSVAGPVETPGEAPDVDVVHSPDAPGRTLVRRGEHLWQASDGLRYLPGDGAVFDSFEGSRVVVSNFSPESALPPAFYGTVTGTLLAWRGLIPMHGSAVEWNGQGVLLCGPSGAGKSTAAAALISRGARLVSDDLSVLHAKVPGGPPVLYAGRTFVRLFPALAEALAAHVALGEVPAQSGRKRAVTPPRAAPWAAMTLRAVVYLGAGTATPPRLCAQLFRPRALEHLPGQRWRLSSLAFAEPHLRTARVDQGPIRTAEEFEGLADRMVRTLAEVGL